MLYVHVIPNAKKPGVSEDATDDKGIRHLKVKVATPPEDGKANQSVIEAVANYLGVKRNSLSIESGQTSRLKRLRFQA